MRSIEREPADRLCVRAGDRPAHAITQQKRREKRVRFPIVEERKYNMYNAIRTVVLYLASRREAKEKGKKERKRSNRLMG